MSYVIVALVSFLAGVIVCFVWGKLRKRAKEYAQKGAKIISEQIIFLLVLGLLAPVVAHADFLACDLQPNIVASEIMVDNGQPITGIAVVSGSNLLLLDVSGFSTGPHQFKARLQDASGWWSDWTANPFDASKPDAEALKIVDK